MTRVLMIVTSHGAIDGRPATGVWFSEFAEPYEVLTAAGIEVLVASPRGGPAPVDPRGYPAADAIAGVRDALERLNATVPLSAVGADAFDGVFVPGGHGPMFDLATDPGTKALVAAFWTQGKVVGSVAMDRPRCSTSSFPAASRCCAGAASPASRAKRMPRTPSSRTCRFPSRNG